ncbi:MAG: hypothetical protein OXC08_20755 [Thiotrichales bacterium]|nr:hypothetical protein [Thiotrichales bacterium]
MREIAPGKFVSAVPCLGRAAHRVVQYGVGLRTIPRPGCGPLAVFVDSEHAMAFAEDQVLRISPYFPTAMRYRIFCAYAVGGCCPPPSNIKATALWDRQHSLSSAFLTPHTFLAEAVTLIQTAPDGSPAP